MKYVVEKHILFEDNHLLVLFKPKGMLTQPTHLEAYSLEGCGKKYIKEHYLKKGEVFLHALHRLDKPVEGIVVFAKTSKALSRLNRQIREGVWQKTYIAKLDRPMGLLQGECIDTLYHEEFYAKVVPEGTPGGKKAHLHYKTKPCGEVVIHLLTGRYHQIRVQFASRGSPIQGDRKYGSQIRMEGGIELRHCALTIQHPVSGDPLKFCLDKSWSHT